jgi:hypothetical protein
VAAHGAHLWLSGLGRARQRIAPHPENDMKHIFTGLIIVGFLALLLAGFCSCASNELQKSSAEKEREAWYSNYVDNTDKVWSEHL